MTEHTTFTPDNGMSAEQADDVLIDSSAEADQNPWGRTARVALAAGVVSVLAACGGGDSRESEFAQEVGVEDIAPSPDFDAELSEPEETPSILDSLISDEVKSEYEKLDTNEKLIHWQEMRGQIEAREGQLAGYLRGEVQFYLTNNANHGDETRPNVAVNVSMDGAQGAGVEALHMPQFQEAGSVKDGVRLDVAELPVAPDGTVAERSSVQSQWSVELDGLYVSDDGSRIDLSRSNISRMYFVDREGQGTGRAIGVDFERDDDDQWQIEISQATEAGEDPSVVIFDSRETGDGAGAPAGPPELLLAGLELATTTVEQVTGIDRGY